MLEQQHACLEHGVDSTKVRARVAVQGHSRAVALEESLENDVVLVLHAAAFGRSGPSLEAVCGDSSPRSRGGAVGSAPLVEITRMQPYRGVTDLSLWVVHAVVRRDAPSDHRADE